MPNPQLSILVVDDAKFSSVMIGRALSKAGYQDIRFADSASVALALIEQRPANVLLAEDGDDLQVAALVAEFAEEGLEPRHLRHFATQADRESDLIRQIVVPRTGGLDGDTVADANAAMAALTVRLHTVLVRNRLRS